jgi:hypothetical protein
MAKCGNREEGQRLIQGFFTEDCFRRGVANEPPNGYDIIWAIQPEETEIESLQAVVLGDGREAAQIAPIHNPGEFLIFTLEDGHWVIDEAYVIVDEYNWGPPG